MKRTIFVAVVLVVVSVFGAYAVITSAVVPR